MKTLPLLAALLLAGCAHHAASIIDTAPVAQNLATIGDSLTKIKSAKSVQTAETLAEGAIVEVGKAQKNLSTIKDYADKLQFDRDWWKDYATQKEAEVRSLQQKLSHFNHLLFILSGIAGILAGLVVGRFAMAFSPYGALVGVGVGAITFGGVWALLGHL
jgi:hypothetical protein